MSLSTGALGSLLPPAVAIPLCGAVAAPLLARWSRHAALIGCLGTMGGALAVLIRPMSEADAQARELIPDVQQIERAVEHLDQTLDEAREAVRRAQRADSMGSEGEQYADPDAEPAVPAEPHDEDDDSEHADEAEGAGRSEKEG